MKLKDGIDLMILCIIFIFFAFVSTNNESFCQIIMFTHHLKGHYSFIQFNEVVMELLLIIRSFQNKWFILKSILLN